MNWDRNATTAVSGGSGGHPQEPHFANCPLIFSPLIISRYTLQRDRRPDSGVVVFVFILVCGVFLWVLFLFNSTLAWRRCPACRKWIKNVPCASMWLGEGGGRIKKGKDKKRKVALPKERSVRSTGKWQLWWVDVMMRAIKARAQVGLWFVFINAPPEFISRMTKADALKYS